MHIFDHWSHLITVDIESYYARALASKYIFALDYDTYKFLFKALTNIKYKIFEYLIGKTESIGAGSESRNFHLRMSLSFVWRHENYVKTLRSKEAYFYCN